MYCDFYSIPKREDEIPKFIESLAKEISLYADSLSIDWEFDTLFLGGGTPSLFTPKGLELILETLDQNFNLSNVKEITLEANPGEAPFDKLKAFRELGVNRLSMGFQSFDANLLNFLGRIHGPEDCFKTFENARKAGFDNINADLIFDIPGQSLSKWKQDLKTLVELQPEHISAYSLTVEENTTLFGLVKSGKVKMPSDILDLAMFKHTRNYLAQNGFKSYEISNFCKTGMKCKHNLHYWNLDKYLAFGPSAHGFNGEVRWWNVKSLDEYFKKVNNDEPPLENFEILSDKDHFNELIFNGLRMVGGIPTEKLAKLFSGDFESYLNAKIQKWDGLEVSENKILLNEKGIMLADEIASDLFID
ncbi:MAG: radical SAM family heme chaperone HemW [Candidatus Marinimicrobia bacterium]|nr:radical SAM family heme chaperone HemW [Candidatus Neomarinimicrobiota bacterium]